MSTRHILILFILFILTAIPSFRPLGAEEQVEGKSSGKQAKDKSKSSKSMEQEKFEAAVMAEVKKRLEKIEGPNVAKLSKELLEKDYQLKKRESLLKEREEQLKIHEKDLLKRIKEFDSEQEKVLGCIKKNEDSYNDRANQIVSVISNMKPAKAAEILSVQDLPISVRILGMLEPSKSSKIFNLMDKEISARIQKMYLTMKK